MPPSEDLRELLRLTKENNRILHKMRRDAFLGGLIKIVLYVVFFVAIPFWLYATYLGPVVEQMLKTYQDIQGTGANAQAQFSDFQNILKQFQNQFSSQE